MSTTLNSSVNYTAVAFWSCYILFGGYLFILVFQRITYTFGKSKTWNRFMLLLMILIWCICNSLHLISCFISEDAAKTNPVYKTCFYIEFYFDNFFWNLSLIFQAYNTKFSQSNTDNTTITRRAPDGKRYSSIDKGYDDDDPLHIDDDNQRQQRSLHIDDVDLTIKPSANDNNDQDDYKHQKKSDSIISQNSNYDPLSSRSSKKTDLSSLKPPEAVYDLTKQKQNFCFWFLDVFVIGGTLLLVMIIFYSCHTDYMDEFEYTDDWGMRYWHLTWDHHENTTVTTINRGFISVWLWQLCLYYRKEFYTWWISFTFTWILIIYWLGYSLFILHDITSNGSGDNVFHLFQPIVYYGILFCLHGFDADRDKHPSSQSVFVNSDNLELYYIVYPARKDNNKIAPNIFCFGPNPIIQHPSKSSIIILGGWGNVKEDYVQLASLLSVSQRNVILFDYRGVGETGIGPETKHNFYNDEQYVNDIIDLIKHITQQYNDEQTNLMDINDDDEKHYDENDQFASVIPGHKVYLVGLSMGGNVALKCALHEEANELLEGIIVCSAHGGGYLLKKGPNFEAYGNQIVTGNALHYGMCEAQKLYIEYGHSKTYRLSWLNRQKLFSFYSWHSSISPYYCCNVSRNNIRGEKGKKIQENNTNTCCYCCCADKEVGVDLPKNPDDLMPSASQWFKATFGPLSIRPGLNGKHKVVEGIERQTDIAEEGFNIAQEIQDISIPVYVLYGDEDQVIDKQTAELLHKTIGNNADIQVFKNGGHNFWFEDIKKFAKTVKTWMDFVDEQDLY